MSRVVCALGPDSAGTLVRNFMESARSRLDVAVYEVGPSFGWMLPRAVQRGVRVRVLLDGHGMGNRGCVEEIERAAARGIRVPCRVQPQRELVEAHWKLLVRDAGGIAVGTGNLIERDAPADAHGRMPPGCDPLAGTREWWAFVDGAPGLASRARSRITAAWRDAVPPPPLWALEVEEAAPPVGSPRPSVPPLEVELSPRSLHLVTDGRSVRDAVLAALEPKRRACLLTVPYIHTWAPEVRALVARLAEHRSARADVRVLLGTPPAGADAAHLRDRGLDVRVMDPLRSTTGHAKGLVVDGSVLVMSANWSAAGLGASLECALRIDHPAAAAYYADAFQRDWDVAEPA